MQLHHAIRQFCLRINMLLRMIDSNYTLNRRKTPIVSKITTKIETVVRDFLLKITRKKSNVQLCPGLDRFFCPHIELFHDRQRQAYKNFIQIRTMTSCDVFSSYSIYCSLMTVYVDNGLIGQNSHKRSV